MPRERANSRLPAGIAGVRLPLRVERFACFSQRQPRDVAKIYATPNTASGETAVRLRGKNFCSATSETKIAGRVEAGYPAVAPDPIGFGKSSKPQAYRRTFQKFAANARGFVSSPGTDPLILTGAAASAFSGATGVNCVILWRR